MKTDEVHLIAYVGATLTVVTHATEDEDNINNYILVWLKLLYNTNGIPQTSRTLS